MMKKLEMRRWNSLMTKQKWNTSEKLSRKGTIDEAGRCNKTVDHLLVTTPIHIDKNRPRTTLATA
jgi:hypothetical protein